MASQLRSHTLGIIASLVCAFCLLETLLAASAFAQLQQNRVRQRYDRVAKGANIAEWHKRLFDPDPSVRLDAVDSLGKDGTEASVGPLLEATSDVDDRVRLKAFDYIGSIGSSLATPRLTQYLFLTTVDDPSKKRILVALGRIRDPRAAKPVLNFAKNCSDEELLSNALYALGETGEISTLEGLEGIRDASESPRIKRVASDAIAKINNRTVAKPNAQPTLIELERRLRPQAGRTR